MVQYRHKKHGRIYEVISDHALLQCSSAPQIEEMFEDDLWIVYRNIETGAVFVRPAAEFEKRFDPTE